MQQQHNSPATPDSSSTASDQAYEEEEEDELPVELAGSGAWSPSNTRSAVHTVFTSKRVNGFHLQLTSVMDAQTRYPHHRCYPFHLHMPHRTGLVTMSTQQQQEPLHSCR